jgi:tRNA A22 N-methylase
MPRPKGSKNKTADKIAKEAEVRLSKQLSKETSPEVAKEIAEAVQELSDIADLLAPKAQEEFKHQEVLSSVETPEIDEEIVVENAEGLRRLIGRHPITKEPVYK